MIVYTCMTMYLQKRFNFMHHVCKLRDLEEEIN